MALEDRDYYTGRAEAQLKLAVVSEDPQVVRAHYQLAELHLERAEQCEAEEVEQDDTPETKQAAA